MQNIFAMYIDLYQIWSLKSVNKNETTRKIYEWNILNYRRKYPDLRYVIYAFVVCVHIHYPAQIGFDVGILMLIAITDL